ncbi:sodium:calcium antiporter [Patescibacteria group bacterium]
MSIINTSLNLGLLIISAVVLAKTVRVFVNSSSKIADLLGISSYTISFLLVSLATSLPELVVSITSGIEKNTILAYGNAIGSNLALITLIVALPILVGQKISTKGVIKSKDIYFSAFFLLLALALALDGLVTRFDGLIMISGYIVYVRAVLKKETLLETLVDRFEHTNVWKQGVLFSISLLLILAASEGIVTSAINLSSSLNLSLGYIGLTITAIGTSLPEIAFALGVIKSRHREKDEIMGDVIGSVVANSTIVLGTAALIHPIDLHSSIIGFPSMLILISTLILFLAFSKSNEELDKKEAMALLGVYFLFLGVEYFLIV